MLPWGELTVTAAARADRVPAAVMIPSTASTRRTGLDGMRSLLSRGLLLANVFVNDSGSLVFGIQNCQCIGRMTADGALRRHREVLNGSGAEEPRHSLASVAPQAP